MSKILLVEDDKHERQGLSALLKQVGHEIEVAENGKFALEVLSEIDNFDIVITDLIMPVTDGLRFLHSVRNSGNDIPVIVITGHENIENMLSAYELGAVDVLYKPYDFNQLKELIKKISNLF